jgi:hypothetical protein
MKDKIVGRFQKDDKLLYTYEYVMKIVAREREIWDNPR